MCSTSSTAGSFRDKPSGPPCTCDEIFSGFLWHELTTLRPKLLPREPGVYALRVIGRGRDVAEVIESFRKHTFQSEWSELIDFVKSRLTRIEGIGGSECPVLYIGSTGNLTYRYRRLIRGGHTVFFAVLPLLLNGWRIEYGYLHLESGDEAKCKESSYCTTTASNTAEILLLTKKIAPYTGTEATSNL